MVWKIKITASARKELSKIEPQAAKRILVFLKNRIGKIEDPRSIGEALKGSKLGDFWKYRVGDYRIIADIEDKAVQILVIKIGNRREIYRKN